MYHHKRHREAANTIWTWALFDLLLEKWPERKISYLNSCHRSATVNECSDIYFQLCSVGGVIPKADQWIKSLFSCFDSVCVLTPYDGASCLITLQSLHVCYVCYWPPAPDPQLGESWPLEQVHMLGLEQKPSPHEFLQIAGGQKQ